MDYEKKYRLQCSRNEALVKENEKLKEENTRLKEENAIFHTMDKEFEEFRRIFADTRKIYDELQIGVHNVMLMKASYKKQADALAKRMTKNTARIEARDNI